MRPLLLFAVPPRFPLRHVHLAGLTPYLEVSAIQSRIVRTHLDQKALRKTCIQENGDLVIQSPIPTLLTFQTPPTYTCGRREIGKLSQTQITHLKNEGKAEFFEALRGGQTTFHGPGQLVAYLIITLKDTKSATRKHVRLLEESIIQTCSKYGVKGFRTENPGVWTSQDRKIASVGIHLRRYVASHGIALNVSVDLNWFDRIVACGLEGKKATSLLKESVSHFDSNKAPDLSGTADFLAKCVAEELPEVTEVVQVTLAQIIGEEEAESEILPKILD